MDCELPKESLFVSICGLLFEVVVTIGMIVVISIIPACFGFLLAMMSLAFVGSSETVALVGGVVGAIIAAIWFWCSMNRSDSPY